MASPGAQSVIGDYRLFSIRPDPRTIHWFFVGNKLVLALLVFGYVYVAKIGGPRFMKNRKPYDGLKPLIALYNIGNALSNAWFVSAVLSRTYLGGGYSLICQGTDFDAKDENTMMILSLEWWYTVLRIGDFLDTFFFVLRKKDSHVSFLHVTHHVLVVFNCWVGLTYGADGQAVMVFVVNGSVHVVMYFYYFLSLLGPTVQKYLWWKRYLTQLQLVQFAVLFIHACMPLFISCGYPRVLTYVALPQGVFFVAMFMNFYLNAYKQRPSATETQGVRKSKHG